MGGIDLSPSVSTMEEIGFWKNKEFYMGNIAKRYWLMNK